MGELGRRWAVLDKDVKTDWEEKGKIAKTEYDEAMSNYKPSDEFLMKKAANEQKMVQKKKSKKETPTGGIADVAGNTVDAVRINAEAAYLEASAFSVFSSQMKLAVEKEMDDLNPWEVKQALWAKWQPM